jgi:ribonuclease P protein component
VTALAHTTGGELSGRVRNAAFPRIARLLQASDFKSVFKHNRASSDRFFRILFRPNSGPVNRLGMAVSRKIDPKAVGRNRIKRVARESFRTWCSRQTQTDPSTVDIVVLPRPLAATTCNAELFRSLDRHWSRISDMADRQPAPATGKLKDKE